MVQGLSFVEEEVKHCCAALQGELCRMAESGYTPLWVKLTAAQRFAWQKLQQDLTGFHVRLDNVWLRLDHGGLMWV